MKKIAFSSPMHTGMDISVLNNKYRVFTPCIFLPTAVMNEIEKNEETLTLVFSDSITADEGECLTIESNTSTIVTYKDKAILLLMSKDELIKEILSSFKENALYWVAGPNYRRMLNNHPDEAAKYLSAYVDKEHAFIEKINELEKATL